MLRRMTMFAGPAVAPALSAGVTTAHASGAACASAGDGCAAIALDSQSGNELTAHLQGNRGTVHSPDDGIDIAPDSGLYNVTEINNHIHVV